MSLDFTIMSPPAVSRVNDVKKEKLEETSIEDYPELLKILPSEYNYHMCSFETKENGFHAEIRLPVTDEEGAREWMKAYQTISKETFRVEATKPRNGRINIMKVYYCCQHKTLPRTDTVKKSSKNTNCQARMIVTVKQSRHRQSRAKWKDLHLPMFPMVVRIEHTHNHRIKSADILKFRDVSADTVEKFKLLFRKGHSPASALYTHKLDLQLEYGADYVYEAADRANCPDLYFCHRLYRKIFDKAYHATTGEKMVQDLEDALKSYNGEQGEECGKISQINGKLAIALCTPLMKRVHQKHKYSGELVLIYASAGMNSVEIFVGRKELCKKRTLSRIAHACKENCLCDIQ
ncbi:hypothetical protein GJAV_G00210010 [Gymnothorax javanicus]|nr:hypothetical protein GJAV_G00210010 [Gymnothorax javanicus]